MINGAENAQLAFDTKCQLDENILIKLQTIFPTVARKQTELLARIRAKQNKREKPAQLVEYD